MLIEGWGLIGGGVDLDEDESIGLDLSLHNETGYNL